MAKNKKSVDIKTKKENIVAVSDSSNGKIKKQKNKKNMKAGGSDNSATKSPILIEKNETAIVDVEESIGLKKEAKKGKKVITDKAVAGEVLSNPKIAKKKSKKEIIETVIEPVSPTKTKRKNVAAEKDGKEVNVVRDKKTESGKKRNSSTTADEDDEVETEPIADKKKKKVNAPKEEDQEMNVSPKKQKLKEMENDDETPDEATKDKTPSISVFVGNLPLNTKRGKILKLFSKFGKVKSIRFRLSNGVKFFKSQSKITSPNVIAFVDYEAEEDAKASLVLNGEKIKDNVLRVNLQANAKSADSFDGKRTVFVGNLKYSVTDQNLHDLFSCCGDIDYARTMQCDKGCNGIGYVCFKKTESISMALELNNSDLQGRPVRVERYVKKSPGGPKEKKNKKGKPTGAVRRLDKKQKVKTFSNGKGKETNPKASFAGMKAKEKKKGFVKKGKKPLKGPKLLAKKIASRDKVSKAT